MIDDKELMMKMQEGQLEKLAILYEHYKIKLYNYFLRMGNSQTHSEDLVQETFMKVLAYRSSFNGTSTFSSWLYGIARNTAADHYRKTKHTREHEEIDEQVIESNNCTSENYDQVQKQALFDKSLNDLPAEQREIIILSRFQQLSYNDIARLLDCNLNTLKSKMRLAISQLHQKYLVLSGEKQ